MHAEKHKKCQFSSHLQTNKIAPLRKSISLYASKRFKSADSCIHETLYNYFIPFWATVKMISPKVLGNSSPGCPQHLRTESFKCRPERYDKFVLLLNSFFQETGSCDREIVQNMSPGDSSLRIGSNWLAFVSGKKALASQMLYNFSYSTSDNKYIHVYKDIKPFK